MKLQRFQKFNFKTKKDLVKHLKLHDGYPGCAVCKINNNDSQNWLWRVYVDGVGDENLADAKVIDILEKTAKTHPRNLGCSNNFINENKNVITEIGFVMEHHPCTPSKVYKTKHIRWVFSRIPSYEHTECVEFLGCFTIKTFHWVKQEAGIYKAVFSWDGKDEYEL